MSKIVQWKRGNTAVNSTYVGAAGEITIDTAIWTAYVHDGITSGGHAFSAGAMGNLTIGGVNGQTFTGTVANANIVFAPNGSGVLRSDSGISAAGAITGPNITVVGFANVGGALNVTGNISAGNITGGNITGGNITTTGTVYGNAAPGAAGNISNAVGYIGMPQNSQLANYTLALIDQGKHIYLTANSNITIPANSSISFPIGSAISVVNGPNVQSNVIITTDTLYLAANGATGTRSISTYGMVTLVKVTNTIWYINGSGIT